VVDDDEPMRNSLGLLFNTVGLKDRYLLIAIRVH
jgi:FixJ family two-component response regulator